MTKQFPSFQRLHSSPSTLRTAAANDEAAVFGTACPEHCPTQLEASTQSESAAHGVAFASFSATATAAKAAERTALQLIAAAVVPVVVTVVFLQATAITGTRSAARTSTPSGVRRPTRRGYARSPAISTRMRLAAAPRRASLDGHLAA